MHETFDVSPATVPEGTTLSLRGFTFVRIGFLGKKLCVLERETGEPLQFIVGVGISSLSELQAHAEKIASWWDELFLLRLEKVRIG